MFHEACENEAPKIQFYKSPIPARAQAQRKGDYLSQRHSPLGSRAILGQPLSHRVDFNFDSDAVPERLSSTAGKRQSNMASIEGGKRAWQTIDLDVGDDTDSQQLDMSIFQKKLNRTAPRRDFISENRRQAGDTIKILNRRLGLNKHYLSGDIATVSLPKEVMTNAVSCASSNGSHQSQNKLAMHKMRIKRRAANLRKYLKQQ